MSQGFSIMQLKNFRANHNLTQNQLAKLLGVTKIAVAKREQAGTVPDQMRIALVLIDQHLSANDYERSLETLVLELLEQGRKYAS